MRLFELADQLERLLADPAVLDLDTGELTPEGERQLDALQGAIEQRALDIASYVKGERCEADAIMNEVRRLLERAKRHERRADSLERYLASHLTPGMKLEDARAEITWRKSTAVEVDEVRLPEEWFRLKVTQAPKKDELRDALKAGQEIPGAKLVERMRMSVR